MVSSYKTMESYRRVWNNFFNYLKEHWKIRDFEKIEALADVIVEDMNKEHQVKEEAPVRKWRCKICGYEYSGEELPENFICPLCKHPASDFEEITE